MAHRIAVIDGKTAPITLNTGKWSHNPYFKHKRAKED